VKTFFVHTPGENLEKQYWAIWNQIFQLKEYCGFSLFELRLMTAEERSWYIQRYNDEMKKRREEEDKASRRTKTSVPRPPSIRR